MSVPLTDERQSNGQAYIRVDSNGGGGVDKQAILHRRRKSAIRSLMFEIEREIEPLLPPEAKQAIADFKRSCRKKINGLTWEAIELTRLEPGESLNEHAVDLAEETFHARED